MGINSIRNNKRVYNYKLSRFYFNYEVVVRVMLY